MAKHKIMNIGSKVAFPGKVTLENLQKAVGGPIEVVHISADELMIVNEEGLLDELLINKTATRMAKSLIVGNVVLLTDEDKKDFMRNF